MHAGPVLIGYDGSSAAEHALREAADLLRGRQALVVVVWKEGLAFELVERPTTGVGLPLAPIDIRAALEADRSLYEAARRGAERAAALARAYVLGDPTQPETTLGPMVRTAAADFVRAQVSEAVREGARALVEERAFALSRPGTPYVAPQILSTSTIPCA